MEPARRFQDLVMCQKSHALTLRTYRLTTTYPKHEIYGLSAQMRRAAVSVSANIAEGFSKRGRPDKARYMNTAQASLEELRYYFLLSRDLGYLEAKVNWDDVDEVSRILGGYIRTLRVHEAPNS
jgi:four helix bundle protein